jgi:hypothetical protein
MGKVFVGFKKAKGGYKIINYKQQANGIINPDELKGWLKNDA